MNSPEDQAVIDAALAKQSGPPLKVRVEAVGPASTVIVKEKVGTVSFLDQAKAYYHTIITVLGAVLIAITQVATFASWIPGPIGGYITVGIAFLTGLINFLKSNEVWVNKLPS